MAVRKIEYTVDEYGINPNTNLFGGIQGEHRATALCFKIEQSVYENFKRQAGDTGKVIYRFDGYDGEGGFKRSDTAELTEPNVEYQLEEWLTRFGGIVKVVLVISLLKDDSTEMELFSFPAKLRLQNLPDADETDGESYESMSVLAEVAKISAETAVNAKEKTELARAALEIGTEWVFDGGNAESGDVNVNFVLDNQMSDSSENAIKNNVVKKYIDDLIKKVKLDSHPIGSLYWSTVNTDPSQLFGGVWKQIKDTFILAAGDKYPAETTGGEAEHILTINEMPRHTHEYRYTGQSSAVGIDKIKLVDSQGTSNAYIGDGGYTGNDFPHNNMPPYITKYCWQRTD